MRKIFIRLRLLRTIRLSNRASTWRCARISCGIHLPACPSQSRTEHPFTTLPAIGSLKVDWFRVRIAGQGRPFTFSVNLGFLLINIRLAVAFRLTALGLSPTGKYDANRRRHSESAKTILLNRIAEKPRAKASEFGPRDRCFVMKDQYGDHIILLFLL